MQEYQNPRVAKTQELAEFLKAEKEYQAKNNQITVAKESYLTVLAKLEEAIILLQSITDNRPTEKQLAYLKVLADRKGVPAPVVKTKAEAGKMIKVLKAQD